MVEYYLSNTLSQNLFINKKIKVITMSKKSNLLKKSFGELTKTTITNYSTAIKQYESFHQQNIDELIQEALDEQTQKVPEHELKIYDRIVDFREHLKEKFVLGTVKAYTTRIISLYKKCRVRIPEIPPINSKTCRRNEYIGYEDILTKDEIRHCFGDMNIRMKARAMSMTSAGLSNAECDLLKTSQFVEDLKIYHQKEDINDALSFLSKSNNIVWCCKLVRAKTKKPYYAIFNPETVQIIAQASLTKKSSDDKLLNTNKKAFGHLCKKINDKYDLGSAGGMSRFRPHMLRKFHATYISGSVLSYEENLQLREIDELQGRGKTNVQDTYIKTNPLRQTLLYCKVMNNVSLYNEYDYTFRDGRIIVECVNSHKKNRDLQNENIFLKKKLKNSGEINQNLKSYVQEVGFDKFQEELYNILKQ